MLVKRIAIVLASLVLSPVCQAARWVEVANGTIAVPADALAHIQATLKERIGSAIRAKGEKPLSWQGYLVQYRGTTVQGEPAVEIHGSCGFNDDKFNARAEFYDEQVADGGECYFRVYLLLKTRQYSNILFHGYA